MAGRGLIIFFYRENYCSKRLSGSVRLTARAPGAFKDTNDFSRRRTWLYTITPPRSSTVPCFACSHAFIKSSRLPSKYCTLS
jgi:hypothetical protein